MEGTSYCEMERYTPSPTTYKSECLPVSEQGFTYLEIVIVLALVTTIFPFAFSFYYSVSNDLQKHLIEHQLYEQFDQFQSQFMRDATNSVDFMSQKNQLIMTMGDRQQVLYRFSRGQIVRSTRQNNTNYFEGNTILLYHVHHFTVERKRKGIQLSIDLMDQGAHFFAKSFAWGRIDA